MDSRDFIAGLPILRCAARADWTGYSPASVASLRDDSRRFALELGRVDFPPPDEPFFHDCIDSFLEEGYLDLRKWNNEFLRWTPRRCYGAFSEVNNGTGFQLRLTPKGLELRARMEADADSARPVTHRPIGFQPA